jgi:hypothetical protein
LISVGAWALCFVFQIAASFFMPADVETLRRQLRERAAVERALPLAPISTHP